MILYFSATGNSAFIARELAKLLGDKAVDLREKIRNNDHSPIGSEKPFIVCAHCMGCIQNCPAEAIEYDHATQKKDRYTFDRYKYAAEDQSDL